MLSLSSLLVVPKADNFVPGAVITLFYFIFYFTSHKNAPPNRKGNDLRTFAPKNFPHTDFFKTFTDDRK